MPSVDMCDILEAAAVKPNTGECSSTNYVDLLFRYPVSIGVNNQLISVFANMAVGSVINVHELVGCSQTSL